MIQVENLHKMLGGAEVLKGVSCEVAAGEMLALIGMSGCGKSVLLKHIAGLFQPDAGRVVVDGNDISSLSGRKLEELRSRFGFVFQNGALFDSLTVYDNVAFPLREKTKLGDKEIRERVLGRLSDVGLSGSEHKYSAEISGGMIKRTALARALVTEPEILFFDEPTTGLDPIIARSMLNLFDECHHRFEFTGIIVSHDIPDIFGIVDKVAMLHEGSVLTVCRPEEIQTSEDATVKQFITGSTEGPIRYR